MFQPDPQSFLTLSQVLYLLLAGFIGSVATLLALWQRRKHGPAEVRKLEAEARSLAVRDDLAVGDSVLKLIKEVSQATAEARELCKERDEWERRAEVFLEQLTECQDELAKTRDDHKQLSIRYKKKDHELKVAMRILAEHQISYSEGDALKNLVDYPVKP